MSTATPTKALQGFEIRNAKKVVVKTAATYGEALAWANAHPGLKNHAIFWGPKDSGMNLAEWALIANHAVKRLAARGISSAALLANAGDR